MEPPDPPPPESIYQNVKMMILDSLGLDLVHVLLGAGVGVWHDAAPKQLKEGMSSVAGSAPWGKLRPMMLHYEQR